MKVDEKEAFTRTMGRFVFVVWKGSIAVRTHETIEDAQAFAATLKDIDFFTGDLETDGFLISPAAVS